MNKKIIYSLIVLALIFFFTSLIIFIKSGKEPKSTRSTSLKNQVGQSGPGSFFMTVKAFFFVESSRFMVPVEYKIELSASREENYKKFIDILLKGEENHITPVPEEVELRTLYLIEKPGMLVLDFTEELIQKFPAGTASELEFIYFMVNNICYNFNEIKKVKILIAGNEIQTISGHIDIEQPFYPNFRYFKDE